jgi:hypothetical protein
MAYLHPESCACAHCRGLVGPDFVPGVFSSNSKRLTDEEKNAILAGNFDMSKYPGETIRLGGETVMRIDADEYERLKEKVMRESTARFGGDCPGHIDPDERCPMSVERTDLAPPTPLVNKITRGSTEGPAEPNYSLSCTLTPRPTPRTFVELKKMRTVRVTSDGTSNGTYVVDDATGKQINCDAVVVDPLFGGDETWCATLRTFPEVGGDLLVERVIVKIGLEPGKMP